jgi:hypothetical protein
MVQYMVLVAHGLPTAKDIVAQEDLDAVKENAENFRKDLTRQFIKAGRCICSQDKHFFKRLLYEMPAVEQPKQDLDPAPDDTKKKEDGAAIQVNGQEKLKQLQRLSSVELERMGRQYEEQLVIGDEERDRECYHHHGAQENDRECCHHHGAQENDRECCHHHGVPMDTVVDVNGRYPLDICISDGSKKERFYEADKPDKQHREIFHSISSSNSLKLDDLHVVLDNCKQCNRTKLYNGLNGHARSEFINEQTQIAVNGHAKTVPKELADDADVTSDPCENQEPYTENEIAEKAQDVFETVHSAQNAYENAQNAQNICEINQNAQNVFKIAPNAQNGFEMNQNAQNVFVWYSDSDLQYTLKNIVEPLELRGHRCVLQDRDFALGAAIQENIVLAAETCARSVFVLSNQTAENEWFTFTFHVTFERHLDQSRDHRLLLMRREDVEVGRFVEEVREVVETSTVLHEGDPWFLTRLEHFVESDRK